MHTPIVDLHCHMLPGIDDGPDTMDEALAMARMAVDNGITHTVVTPHLHPGRWENTLSTAQPVYEALRAEISEAGIPLSLGLACEARLDPELLAHLKHGELPMLGMLDDQRLMLLELPHGQIPLGADRFVEKLLSMGIRPVIAHPERNKEAMRNRSKLTVFEELGCLFQLTAGSLLGKFGSSAYDLALALLESPSTFLIASDAHNTRVRIPELLSAREVATKHIGEAAAHALVSDNPWRVAKLHFMERGAETPDEKQPVATPEEASPPSAKAEAAPTVTSAAPRAAKKRTLSPFEGHLRSASQPPVFKAGRPRGAAKPEPSLPTDQTAPSSVLDVRHRVDFIMRLAYHLPPDALNELQSGIARLVDQKR